MISSTLNFKAALLYQVTITITAPYMYLGEGYLSGLWPKI